MADIDAQDDNILNMLAESFATHPMIINRIEKLRDFAKQQKLN